VGIRRLLAAAIVVICVAVPLVESFDTWDHTLSDGNDTEANVVIAALCVGLAISAAATLMVIARAGALPIDRRLHLTLPATLSFANPVRVVPAPTHSPPPLALRI
jgi:hypothetical protein